MPFVLWYEIPFVYFIFDEGLLGMFGACREFCFREDTIEGESRVVLLFEILYIYSLGFVFRLRVSAA